MEAGYFEKVEELCDHYSIKGFINSEGMLQETSLYVDFNTETKRKCQSNDSKVSVTEAESVIAFLFISATFLCV